MLRDMEEMASVVVVVVATVEINKTAININKYLAFMNLSKKIKFKWRSFVEITEKSNGFHVKLIRGVLKIVGLLKSILQLK